MGPLNASFQKKEKRLAVGQRRTANLSGCVIRLSDGAVKGAVDQQQQFQRAAEAFFQLSFHPGQRALPAGVLPEHDPQGEGRQTALLSGRSGRRIAFAFGLLRVGELPVFKKGLGELQILQQGVHFPEKLHGAVERNVGI